MYLLRIYCQSQVHVHMEEIYLACASQIPFSLLHDHMFVDCKLTTRFVMLNMQWIRLHLTDIKNILK